MGIRSRVKKGLQKIRVLARVIHEESKYPGRPQPHVAAKNPLWGGGDTREGESKDTIEKAKKEETATAQTAVDENTSTSQQKKGAEDNDQGSLNEEGADYWFLQYDDVEGWNESNPGQKKSDEK